MRKILFLTVVALVALSASSASAVVTFAFGTNGTDPSFITGSETGVTEARNGASGMFVTSAPGGSAGVTFDITLTPNIRTVNPQNTGVGVQGGSANSGIDNGVITDNFQEDLTVSISNFSGLAGGETLVITDIMTRFGNGGSETYTINGGSDQPFGPDINFSIDIPDGPSFTIGAGDPATADTRFALSQITVAVVPEPSAVVMAALGLSGIFFRRRLARSRSLL